MSLQMHVIFMKSTILPQNFCTVQLLLPRTFYVLSSPCCFILPSDQTSLYEMLSLAPLSPHLVLTTCWQICSCIVCLVLLKGKPYERETSPAFVHYCIAKFLIECLANSKDSKIFWNEMAKWLGLLIKVFLILNLKVYKPILWTTKMK